MLVPVGAAVVGFKDSPVQLFPLQLVTTETLMGLVLDISVVGTPTVAKVVFPSTVTVEDWGITRVELESGVEIVPEAGEFVEGVLDWDVRPPTDVADDGTGVLGTIVVSVGMLVFEEDMVESGVKVPLLYVGRKDKDGEELPSAVLTELTSLVTEVPAGMPPVSELLVLAAWSGPVLVEF